VRARLEPWEDPEHARPAAELHTPEHKARLEAKYAGLGLFERGVDDLGAAFADHRTVARVEWRNRKGWLAVTTLRGSEADEECNMEYRIDAAFLRLLRAGENPGVEFRDDDDES
jgi:hypothetical protein